MNHLTVADLKRELQTRGVSDTSNKTEMLKRLEQAVEEILDDLGPKIDERKAESARSAHSIKPSTSQISLADKLQLLQLQQEENKLKLRHLEIETAKQRKQIEREIQEIAKELKIEEQRRVKDTVSNVSADVENSAISYSSCRSPFAGHEQDPESVLRSPTLDILRQMQLPRMSLLNFDGDIMQYGNFIRQFEAVVANKTKCEEEKLYYLHQMTTGIAKDIVETCLYLPPEKGYAEARRLLHKRYGDGKRVATALVDKILAWHAIESNDVAALDEFAIYVRGCLNALKNVPQGMSEVDPKVIRQMLGRLPRELTEKWRINVYDIEEQDGRKPDFEDFVCFIEKIARIASNPWYGRHLFPEVRTEKARTKVKTMAGSSAALSHCIYCKNPHEVSECQELRSLSEEARKSYVLKMGLCFGCLEHGHMAKSCNQRRQCTLCKGRHPTALHRAPSFTGANSTSANHISNDQGPVYGGKLNVLPVLVLFEGRTIRTNAFLDSGSTHSFCCSSLLQKLNYHPQERTVLQLNTVNNRQSVQSHIIRGIKISNLAGSEEMVLPPLFTLNEIPLNSTDIPRDYDSTSHLRKQGVYIHTIRGPIELLH